MEDLVAAYRNRSVFVTGHTGFKGSWLTLWLSELQSNVTGFSLPAADQCMFRQTGVDTLCNSITGDIRNIDEVEQAIARAQPDFVFHLAAQPLVLSSYSAPLQTVETNVLGTANLLEAIRRTGRPCTIIIVTSDKCYENREWVYAYRENDAMGGHDVYSASKGAAELIIASYARSFFCGDAIRVATVRAGNVIGGGDWAEHRIVPDAIRALSTDVAISVRNPRAVRPWQHVLDPLYGYLLLGVHLSRDPSFSGAWNFGPRPEDTRTVESMVQTVIKYWGKGAWSAAQLEETPHEAATLRLAIEKATAVLKWQPRWGFEEAVARTVSWYRAAFDGASSDELAERSRAQIREFTHA